MAFADDSTAIQTAYNSAVSLRAALPANPTSEQKEQLRLQLIGLHQSVSVNVASLIVELRRRVNILDGLILAKATAALTAVFVSANTVVKGLWSADVAADLGRQAAPYMAEAVTRATVHWDDNPAGIDGDLSLVTAYAQLLSVESGLLDTLT